ncbi:DNA N-glycosylase and apurinic/apyrimidinic (AP) lyase [Actinomortierella wolfii]|nr:DNA N-glycosylase and apurinic/apyrimidinic (AP) lyase [Actinomortierella wolfii]
MSTRSSARLREAARIKTEPSSASPLSLSPSTPPSSNPRKRTRAAARSSNSPSYYDSSAIQQDLELDERALRRLRLEADDIRRALEQQDEVKAEADDDTQPSSAKANTSRRGAKNGRSSSTTVSTPPQTSEPSSSGSNGGKQPKHWKSVLDDIRTFRLRNTAPVDTMGCERLAEVGEHIPPQVSRFQTLMALVLSSQTKDTVTSVAIRRLQAELEGGLTIESVLAAKSEDLNRIISAVGFHNKKTVFMKQIAEICRTKYAGDIPDNAEELIALPGVGPKMAYLTLQVAWKKNLGIGVDTHVHRIANRLGWVKTEKDGPEATRKALQSWLPKEHWREINYLLVGFGQVLCLPRGPRCDICPVRDRCPSAPRSAKMKPIIKEESLMDIKPEPVGGAVVAIKTEDNTATIERPWWASLAEETAASSSTTDSAIPPPPAEGEVMIHTRPSAMRQRNSRSASPSDIPIKQEDKEEDSVVIKQEAQDEETSSKYFTDNNTLTA